MCKRTFQIMLLTAGIALSPAAMAGHFNYLTTDVNASVLIRDAVLTSHHWGSGDEIGVFTPSGHCAGSVAIGAFPLGLAAWGDDAFTDSIEGFRDGEAMHFIGWDSTAQREFPISDMLLLEGDSVWHLNALDVADLAESGRHFMPTPTSIRQHLICSRAEISEGDSVRSLVDLDQIGILTPGGLVAGILIWDAPRQEAEGWAFGDSPNTDPLDGFRAGERCSFVYWLHARQIALQPVNITSIVGDSTFHQGDTTRVELEYVVSSVRNRPLPLTFEVAGPYPNPFNSVGHIEISLPQREDVKLDLYDGSGRLLESRNLGSLEPGRSQVSLDLGRFATGLYWCRVEAGSERRNLKLLLLK